jgi:hypothetical protein
MADRSRCVVGTVYDLNENFNSEGNDRQYGASLKITRDFDWARLVSVSAYRNTRADYLLDEDSGAGGGHRVREAEGGQLAGFPGFAVIRGVDHAGSSRVCSRAHTKVSAQLHLEWGILDLGRQRGPMQRQPDRGALCIAGSRSL